MMYVRKLIKPSSVHPVETMCVTDRFRTPPAATHTLVVT